MLYYTTYNSPVGKLFLASEDNKLIGLWIEGQKYFLESIKGKMIEKEDLLIFNKTKDWLDRYFKGENPSISELDINPKGNTFRKMVWVILTTIPYGEVITYGDIAKIVSKKLNKKSMSSQAIGGAVGHNPISIIIPCHRVVGKNNKLTGYAGGIDNKLKLLQHEKVEFFINN